MPQAGKPLAHAIPYVNNLIPGIGSPGLDFFPRFTEERCKFGPNLSARLSLSEKPNQTRDNSHNRRHNRTNRVRNNSPAQKFKARSCQLQALNEATFQHPSNLTNSRPELLKEAPSLSQPRKHLRKASAHQRFSDAEKLKMLRSKRHSLAQGAQGAGDLTNRPHNRIRRFHAHKSKHKSINNLLILAHEISKRFKNRNEHTCEHRCHNGHSAGNRHECRTHTSLAKR